MVNSTRHLLINIWFLCLSLTNTTLEICAYTHEVHFLWERDVYWTSLSVPLIFHFYTPTEFNILRAIYSKSSWQIGVYDKSTCYLKKKFKHWLNWYVWNVPHYSSTMTFVFDVKATADTWESLCKCSFFFFTISIYSLLCRFLLSHWNYFSLEWDLIVPLITYCIN